MKTSSRTLLALAILTLVVGAIRLTPRASNSNAIHVASEKLGASEPAKVVGGTCGDEANAAGGVRHSRAFLYLLR